MNEIAAPKPTQQGTQEFQFFPTPPELVFRLVAQYHNVRGTALEPSAGRGDIADRLKTFPRLKVLCCESSDDLRRILFGKGHNVIGSDFMALVAPYQFNLIVMNPPFRHAAKHVLHAWSMLAPDGDLAAVLPQTAIGKQIGDYLELNQLIEKYGSVESVGAAFSKAARSTLEPCVIVRLKKPAAQKFEPFANFKPPTDTQEDAEPEYRDLPASRDLVRSIVSQYEAAMRALRVAYTSEMEFRQYVPVDMFKYEPEAQKPNLITRIDQVKETFWNLIFDRTKIGEVTTSNYREKFMAERARLSQMEFSEKAIYEVLHTFIQNRSAIMDECVMDFFKHVTGYSRDNAIADKQWATNKGWKIAPKIIVPNFQLYSGGWSMDYRTSRFLDDLDKILAMFGGDKGVCSAKEVDKAMDDIRHGRVPYDQKFECSNILFRVFKKGTMHIWFKDQKVLEMINRYAAERQMFILGSGK